MMKTITLSIIGLSFCLVTGSVATNRNAQWRGPERTGVYLESGLSKAWPPHGPDLLWSAEGLGEGHGSVAVAHDRVYIAGMLDTEGTLFCFDQKGELLWKTAYGFEWSTNYPGVRSTPTVIGKHLYLESGKGLLICFDSLTGEILWSVDLLERYDAENIRWGMAESPLVDKDVIYATPGGPEHNVVALDRFTGKTIWTSPGNKEQAAYCSPILVDHNGRKLIVTMTTESIIGIDAKSGEMLWHVPQFQRNKIHANSPYYENGHILCISAENKPNSGAVLLRLSTDGRSVEQVWRNIEFNNLMASFIVNDGMIYGSRYRKNEWLALDWNTGKILHRFEGLGDGVLIYSDGLYYAYSQDGDMALLDISAQGYKLISRFPVELGRGPHWSHPVIQDGRLYLRHGNVLMVYDIKK
jgi:outer membrane protein assembly factor BamB